MTIDIKMQTRLLNHSNKSGIPLGTLLESKGISYNDLRYIHNADIDPKDFPQLQIAPSQFEKVVDEIPVVSFFSGCGGIDLGLESLGFKHVALFEKIDLFCNTLRLNRPEWKVYGPPTDSGDVSNREAISQRLDAIIERKFEGLFVGGPPCQPFSIAANQRFSRDGDNFKRIGFSNPITGNLLFDYVYQIIKFQPRAFLIENVPGIVELDGGRQLEEAFKLLSAAGYKVNNPQILNASNYGIPQNRIRAFIIGARGAAGKKSLKLPDIQKKVPVYSVLRNIPQANNEIRNHSAESLLRYRMLDFGERDQLGRVDRLNPNLPSKTIIAGGSNGGGRSHLHPMIPRTLSVRECARIQTFPDDFVFTGSTARQFTQVGNAVPPVLAGLIGNSMVEAYFS